MTYAIYIYDRTKRGYEKWEYKRDIETTTPEYAAKNLFEIRFGKKAKTKTFEAKIKINDTQYRSMIIAFNGIDKEIVLAERI